MADANRVEKEHPDTGMGKQSTNPTWALGLVAFSIVSFIIGLFILPQKVEIVRFVEIATDRETVWNHLDEIEDWDSWDSFGHKHKKKNGIAAFVIFKIFLPVIPCKTNKLNPTGGVICAISTTITV